MNPRRRAGWGNDFGRWVGDYGAQRLAWRLGISSHAVYNWISGSRQPKPMRALQIVALSGGRLSFDQIYAPHASSTSRTVVRGSSDQ